MSSTAAVASAINVSTQDWGDEEEYFSRKGSVSCCSDISFLSILLYWLLLPLNLTVTLLGTCNDSCLRGCAAFTRCSSRQCGRPCCLAPFTWWYQWMVAFRLICCSKKSRYTLFNNMKNAYGGGEWWFSGAGFWVSSYKEVRATMESNQVRGPYFGSAPCAVPEVFPKGLLLFLDGDEHRAIRAVIIEMLTDDAVWSARAAELPAFLRKLAPVPCNQASIEKGQCDRMVAAAVWYLLFGVELNADQQTVIASWGAGSDTAKGAAGFFVFPRFVQRCLCNLILKKIKALRVGTMQVFKEHGLHKLALQMNNKLGPHKRATGVEFADELLYAICFAGVGGTQHGTWATVQALQKNTVDVPVEGVNWPAGDMMPRYLASPDNFIKEALRLDNPVTSATATFTQDTKLKLNNSGFLGCSTTATGYKGECKQYVLSIANRDPSKFPDPDTFNSERPSDQLDETLTWNGCPGCPERFPRMCPGHKLSRAVIRAVVGCLEEAAEAKQN